MTQEALDLGIQPTVAALTPERVQVFIVDYLDQIKVRELKAYERSVARSNAMWTKNPPPRSEHVFSNSEEAAAFIIARAQSGVKSANARLKNAEARLRKCRKKFAPIKPGVGRG